MKRAQLWLAKVRPLGHRARLSLTAAGIVLLTALCLLPIPGRPLWVAMLFVVLPTLSWIALYRSDALLSPWSAGVYGLGLTYLIGSSVALIIHYLPGPLPRPLVVGAMVLLNLSLLVVLALRSPRDTRRRRWDYWLAAVLILAMLLRLANIVYSEIEGDEALILLQSAQAIGGRDDIVFWHKKGPVELLIPILSWLGNGAMNEGVARLPFTALSLGAVVACHELACAWSGKRAALLAAGLAAVNGYFVAYGRIAQYQSAVLVMLPLALLHVERAGLLDAFVSGLFLGYGLTSHYDAVVVLPAFAYAVLTSRKSSGRQIGVWKRAGAAVAGIALITLPFYVPFLLSPGLQYALQYLLGARLGGSDTLFSNNLTEFLGVDAIYNSSYYLACLALALLVAVMEDLSNWPRPLFLTVLSGLIPAGLSTVVAPERWQAWGVNWAFLPFALLFACCIFAPNIRRHRRATWLWFSVSFLFYFFGVGDPRTHFYNVFTPWILLSAEAAVRWWPRLVRILSHTGRNALVLSSLVVGALIIGFPYMVFVRVDRDYVAGYPESRSPVYWAFTRTIPQNVYFGIPHRVGWKALSELSASGASLGLYNSNEISRITMWYIPEGLRTHCSRPDSYIVDTLHLPDRLDSVALDWGTIEAEYDLAETISVDGEPRLAVYRRSVLGMSPVAHQAEGMGSRFDRAAIPDRWMSRWPQPGVEPAYAEFGSSIRLLGYALGSKTISAGESVPLILYWQTTQLVEGNYVVFVHLIKDGLVQQGAGDSLPDCGAQPTPLWTPGTIVADYHSVESFPDAYCTDCGLFIGMYDLHTGDRLPITVNNERMLGDTLNLTSVSVSSRR